MSYHPFLTLITVIASIFLSTPARAYLRAAPEDSIEWTVFDSDMIVRGRITDLQSAEVSANFQYNIAKVEVTETLKGQPVKTITLLIDTGAPDTWKQGEYVFFLVKSARISALRQTGPEISAVYGTYAFTLRNAWRRTPISLTGPSDRPIFDAYLNVLDKPEQILKVIRNEVAHPPDNQFGMLEIHISAASESFINSQMKSAYRPQYLNLLVDSRAEARAHQWMKSKDPWDRWNGAKVLSHFQSPENVELMRSLLTDPYAADGDWPEGADFRWMGGVGKWRQLGRFPMRTIAYEALKSWNLAPHEAILYRPVYAARYLQPHSLPLILVAVVLLLLLVLVARWIRGVRYVGGLTGVSVLLLITTTALWWRSRTMIDEISFQSAAKERCEIASFAGTIRWTRLSPAELPTPANYTAIKRTPSIDADWDLDKITKVKSLPVAIQGRGGFNAESGSIMAADYATQQFNSFSVPLWTLCALFSLIPLIRTLHWIRQCGRRGKNCCPQCGYDLRATPDRCPECGHRSSPIPASAH